jgi:hypothetical protein
VTTLSPPLKKAGRRCCARVASAGGWFFHGCQKPVRTTVGGKDYCAVHDPAAVARRREADAERQEREHRQRTREAVAGGLYDRLFRLARDVAAGGSGEEALRREAADLVDRMRDYA